MAESMFGVGAMFATPQGTNPTPTRFGRLQDVAVDFQFDMKLLYGNQQFALEQARGKAKIDIKVTMGIIDPALFNNIYFGQSLVTGEILNSIDEAATPAAGTFTVANGANFSQDLGVYNTVTGLFMVRVAAGPAAGQYAVNTATGVYTTNAAQNTQLLRVSYTYTSNATGSKVAFSNPLMGSNVVFAVQLVNQFKNAQGLVKSMYINFNAVQCPKLSMPLKLDDFLLPQLELSAQDDGTGNVLTYSMTG